MCVENDPSTRSPQERLIALNFLLDLTYSVESSLDANSISLLLTPVFILIFAPPVRTYIALLGVVSVAMVGPNWAVCWFMYVRHACVALCCLSRRRVANHTRKILHEILHERHIHIAPHDKIEPRGTIGVCSRTRTRAHAAVLASTSH